MINVCENVYNPISLLCACVVGCMCARCAFVCAFVCSVLLLLRVIVFGSLCVALLCLNVGLLSLYVTALRFL
jgi:hypothetical protein